MATDLLEAGPDDVVDGVAARFVARPTSTAEVSEVMRAAALEGLTVVPRGGGTKLGWGPPPTSADVVLDLSGLDAVLDHQAGDLIVEAQAGATLATLRETVGKEGQRLVVDETASGATVGGSLATHASGPERLLVGTVRDLLIGVTMVRADGVVAKAGGRVVKNVAGYDLGKLFTGSFGTLGLITEVSVRLHPLPGRTATVVGRCADPHRLAAAAMALARQPLEALCLDVGWPDRLLVRFAGRAAAERARSITVEGLDDVHVVTDDEEIWAAQRAAQRDPDGVVRKVAHPPAALGDVLATVRGHGLSAVSRAALGLTWVRGTAPWPDATVLDGSTGVEDPWPPADAGTLALMRRVKARMDPARIFRPGTFVGGM